MNGTKITTIHLLQLLEYWNIIEEKVLADYGYSKSYSKGIYLWSFDGQFKSNIDYEAFAYDLVSSGFGSFNTVIMKK